MFVYDHGLKLLPAAVAVDFSQRQACGFISHAHGDHMARHAMALCTAETASLYRLRLGQRPTQEMPYGEPLQRQGMSLTTLPAGHMLGSAMLLAEHRGLRLLYTGDFQLAASRTARPVSKLPGAEVLVMESTFGEPRWTLPPRVAAEDQLLTIIRQAWHGDRTPVVFAYTAGKAQEVLALLHSQQIAAYQHPQIAAVSRVYQQHGCDIGPLRIYSGKLEERPAVVVLPPRHHRAGFLPCPVRAARIAVTGWALDPRTRHRLEVDHAVPLSDHADFPQLLECVERVRPQIIFCTHGPLSFVDELRRRGHNAYPLDDHAPRQLQRCRDLLPDAAEEDLTRPAGPSPR